MEKTFRRRPKNVAEAIYRITEGELTNHRVIVGLDSQLTTFMHEHIPFWNEIFEIGFDAVVFPIKVAVRIEQMRKNEYVLFYGRYVYCDNISVFP